MSGTRASDEDVVARAGAGRALAVVGVLGLAAALATFPAFVATGTLGGAVAGFAGLVVAVGALKLAAMAWGLAAAVD